MPLYNCASTAAALDVSAKWLDNLLSHNNIDGVTKARQGIPRKLSVEAITTIALVSTLHEHAGIPIANALAIASRALHDHASPLTLGPGVTLTINRDTLQHDVAARLAAAIEVTPAPRRGRPPNHGNRGEQRKRGAP